MQEAVYTPGLEKSQSSKVDKPVILERKIDSEPLVEPEISDSILNQELPDKLVEAVKSCLPDTSPLVQGMIGNLALFILGEENIDISQQKLTWLVHLLSKRYNTHSAAELLQDLDNKGRPDPYVYKELIGITNNPPTIEIQAA